jgi:hypothetical protein
LNTEGNVTGKDKKVIYMPYEATGVLSSLGGNQELLVIKKNVNR